MPSYAIGDVQGCLDPLKQLLDIIQFDPKNDLLWFSGDLVNRGPKSLETLRFIRELGPNHRVVLGNHDLHLLAKASGVHQGSHRDTLSTVLAAPDCKELMGWLSHQPLLQHDPVTGFVMTHAGLPPQWDLSEAKARAAEVEAALQGELQQDYLNHLYGNQPDIWHADLTGWDRLRCITNYFTRMRFCYPDGRLSFLDQADRDALPWFQVKNRLNRDEKILFGHWAALGGKTDTKNVFALDTGCVWGYSLSALRLDDLQRFSVPCPK